MPSVAELEYLSGLMEELRPLARAKRGQPIRADDWNRLVGAILELARAVLGRAKRSDGVAHHAHTDQVGLSWLEPRLRELLERGPLADPVNVERLLQLERERRRDAADLDGLRRETAELRARVLAVQTRDQRRDAVVTALGHTLTGLEDGRDEVFSLRRTLGTLQGDLQKALAAGRSLEIDGELVDVGALRAQVARLEELRTRLERPNGELLDALTLEQRFLELRNTFVTEEELGKALEANRAKLDEDELVRVRAGLEAGLLTRSEERVRTLGETLRGELRASLRDVDAAAARALSRQLPDLEARLVARAAEEAAAAARAAGEETEQGLDQRLDRRFTALEAVRARELARLREELEAGLGGRVERALRAPLGAQNQRIAALESAHQTQAETNARDTDALASLRRAFGTLSTQNRDLRAQLTALETQLEDTRRELETERAAPPDDAVLATARAAATRAARAELRTGLAGLRAEMRKIVQDETKALEERLNKRIDRIGGSRIRIPRPPRRGGQ